MRRRSRLLTRGVGVVATRVRVPGTVRSSGRTASRARGVLVLLALAALPVHAQLQLGSGDRAWDARAEVLEGRLAAPEQIDTAIRSYRTASESDVSSLEARWKLLRASHFLIEFTNAPERRKDEAVEESVSLANTWLAALGEGDGNTRDRAQLYFWAAIVWGARGQRVGLLTIVREGVAGRIHEYAQRAVSIDPEIERGGAYRLLSRLHASLPRVPFVSGWVDRDQVLPLAERAFSIDPNDPGNRLILALALLERAPAREAEAVALLESVAQWPPRPALLVEDLAIREESRQQLQKRGRSRRAGEPAT